MSCALLSFLFQAKGSLSSLRLKSVITRTCSLRCVIALTFTNTTLPIYKSAHVHGQLSAADFATLAPHARSVVLMLPNGGKVVGPGPASRYLAALREDLEVRVCEWEWEVMPACVSEMACLTCYRLNACSFRRFLVSEPFCLSFLFLLDSTFLFSCLISNNIIKNNLHPTAAARSWAQAKASVLRKWISGWISCGTRSK